MHTALGNNGSLASPLGSPAAQIAMLSMCQPEVFKGPPEATTDTHGHGSSLENGPTFCGRIPAHIYSSSDADWFRTDSLQRQNGMIRRIDSQQFIILVLSQQANLFVNFWQQRESASEAAVQDHHYEMTTKKDNV
jgi:hypothetical protein